MNIYLDLFFTFLKIGAFTFGGGWAMISIIEREVVDKHKWMTKPEFIDSLAVAQALPGIFAVNISIMIGDKLRGGKGSLVSTLGTTLPSFIIILMIAMLLTPEFQNNEYVVKIFKGIRPAVVALIIAPVISTAKAMKLNWKTAIIPISAALLIWFRLVSPIVFILLGGIGGYIYYIYLAHNKIKTNASNKEI